jgi:mannose-6-phosphate isomerase-like protein (cupin superfamily)
MATQVKTSEPYALARGKGISDVWFYGGARISVKVDGRHTGARLYQVHIVEVRASGPPLHIHHNADETFYVVDGEVRIVVGDEQVDAGPGDFVFGPQGVPHAYVARSEQAELFATFAPASMDRFFEHLGGVPVVPGEPAPATSYPDPEEFARAVAAWGAEIVGPPLTLDGGRQ